MHTKCKATKPANAPYYWTHCLAIDLDRRDRAPQRLDERYERCCAVFGTPLALRAGGLVVAQGNVELLPTARQTLRLPLGGSSVQLDPSNLNAYPVSSRSAQLTLLVETMEQLAIESPLRRTDLLALAPAGGRLPSPLTRTVAYLRRVPSDAGNVRVDVRRLLSEGLYAGVCRHEAALALARHWMLTRGRSASETVDDLLEWTRHKTNGLSNEAAELGEWPETGSAVAAAAEAERISDACAELSTPAARYPMEVFLHCLVGFAKRYGQPGKAADADEHVAHVELSSKMMQLWPSSSGNGYRARLTQAR